MRLGKILIVGACLATLSFTLVACGGDDEGVVDTITEQAGDAANSVEDAAGDAANSVEDAADDALADDSVTVSLQAQNNSGITGDAKLRSEDGQTKVTFDLENAAGPHPAHIHEGTCADLTPEPKYPLTDVADGTSETTVATTAEALQATPHAINLHKSARDLPTYVACADIPAASGGSTTGTTTTAP